MNWNCCKQTLIIFLIASICFPTCGQENKSFAIVLSTIPPRFKNVASTLISWISQSIPPKRICMYIPLKYKRFRRRQQIRQESFHELLRSSIQSHPNPSLLQWMNEGRLKIIDVENDWGPITRFVGVINEQKNWNFSSPLTESCFDVFKEDLPQYWLFCDDDVFYVPESLQKYSYYLDYFDNLLNGNKNFGLTQFSEDFRVAYQLESDSSMQFIRHVQGVDTYIIPQSRLMEQYCGYGALHFLHMSAAIEFFHSVCPESFYQDDYIVSFLLHLADLEMISIWNYDSLATHIDGISKSNFQMHMDDEVFAKELATKRCVTTYANYILQQISSSIYRDAYSPRICNSSQT